MLKLKQFISKAIFLNILFYFALFILCLALSAQFDRIENDIFSRLIMGQHVIETGRVMYHDTFSYAPSHIWYDHEWLSGVIIYLFIMFLGPSGLTLLKAVLCFLFFTFIDLTIKVKENKKIYPYRYFYFTAIIAMLCSFELCFRNMFHFLRCEKFSFVFYAVSLFILETARKKNKLKFVYYLIPLNLLWLNMHGGSMYILGILFLYGIGELINKKKIAPYFIVLAICILSYVVNPWGFDMVKFLFESTTATRTYTYEWRPASNYAIFILFSLIYVYNLIKTIIKTKTCDFTKLLVYIGTMVLALKYQKFIPLYVITAASFVYSDFKTMVNDITRLIKKYIKFPVIKIKFSYELFYAAILIIYSITIFCRYDIKTNWHKTVHEQFPIKALQFLNDNYITGNVLTPLDFGGQIIYSNYPDMKVYMDTRNEQAYDSSIYTNLMNFFVYGIIDKNNDILKKYNHDIIISERRREQANDYLTFKQDYFKLVYQDEQFLIFLSPQKQRFRYKYPENYENYSVENFFKTSIKF